MLAAVLCTRRATTLLPLAPSGARVQQTAILLPSCTAAAPFAALLRAEEARSAEIKMGFCGRLLRACAVDPQACFRRRALIWCDTENK